MSTSSQYLLTLKDSTVFKLLTLRVLAKGADKAGKTIFDQDFVPTGDPNHWLDRLSVLTKTAGTQMTPELRSAFHTHICDANPENPNSSSLSFWTIGTGGAEREEFEIPLGQYELRAEETRIMLLVAAATDGEIHALWRAMHPDLLQGGDSIDG